MSKIAVDVLYREQAHLCNFRSYLSLAFAFSVVINTVHLDSDSTCKPPGDSEVREKVGPTESIESYWRSVRVLKYLKCQGTKVLKVVVLTSSTFFFLESYPDSRVDRGTLVLCMCVCV